MKRTYFVDGFNEEFNTLRELKWHIECLCENDRAQYNNSFIYRLNDDKFSRKIIIKNNKITLKK